MAKKQITLYRKIDEQDIENSELYLGSPELSYYDSNEEKTIRIDENDLVIAINEIDEQWVPTDHNLIVKLPININKPQKFFGRNSITADSNKIGIAVHMYSQQSHFQKTVSVGSFGSSDDKVSLTFEYNFPPASLRGKIYFRVFIFLKEVNQNVRFQANKVGMILSENYIKEFEIIVDGDGSVFPITEFEDRHGPLWKIEKNWVEASEEIFDSSNVNISLNSAHPLFEQVKGEKSRMSRALMGDIMIQAMSLIIQQVLIIENNNIDETDDIYPNSILAAVKYWVETFEITDTSSLFSISNSLRNHWERKLLIGDDQDD